MDGGRARLRLRVGDSKLAPVPEEIHLPGPVDEIAVGGDRYLVIACADPAKLIVFSAPSLNVLMCRDQADRVVIDRGVEVTDPLPLHEELAEALLM